MPKFPSTDLPGLKDAEDSRATRKALLDLLDKINTVADTAYPVGATYTQYTGTATPASLFGGTWTDITSTSLPVGVYDTGTSASGSWIRYTDGTMECWFQDSVQQTTANISGTLFTASNITYTYPQAFVSAPVVTPIFFRNSAGNSAWGTFGTTLPTATQVVINAASTVTGATGFLGYFATGKWSSSPVYPVRLWQRTK